MAKQVVILALLMTISAAPLPLAFRDIGNAGPPGRFVLLPPYQTAGQSFQCNFSHLFSIGVFLSPPKTPRGEALFFHLKTSPQAKEDVIFQKITADQLKPQGKFYHLPIETSLTSQGFFYYIEFNPLKDSEGKGYYFYLEWEQPSEDPQPRSNLGVGSVKTSHYPGLTRGSLYLDHRPAEGNLAFISYCAWRGGIKEALSIFWNRLKQDPVFLIGYGILILCIIVALRAVVSAKNRQKS